MIDAEELVRIQQESYERASAELRGRRPIAVIGFTVAHGRIVEIDLIADPDKLQALAVDE